MFRALKAAGLHAAKRYREALPFLEQIAHLNALGSTWDATALVHHEEFLLWLMDTYTQLGDFEQAQAVGSQERILKAQIWANPQASQRARESGFHPQGEAPSR